jgi:molybdopterin converting factor small subunit
MSAATDSSATIRVLLFASYAERLGHEALDLTVAPGTSVGRVLELVRALPGGDQLPRHPLCALNLAHVGAEATVGPGDELAILPPLAGG